MRFIITAVLLLFPFVASASAFPNIDKYNEALNKRLSGNDSYQAYLARKFAAFAAEEASQHDLDAARAFIKMSKEAEATAGGSK
jgi:hypothetical protein